MRYKLLVTLLAISTLIFAFPVDTPQSEVSKTASEALKKQTTPQYRTHQRNPHPAPEIEFIPNDIGEAVTPIMESQHDYVPFSYNGHNVQIQNQISQPNEYDAGGIYIGFMGKETSDSNRKVYYAYLNSDNELEHVDFINPCAYHYEGYPSIAVDNYTGNLFSVWHTELQGEEAHSCMFSYNLFNENGNASSWQMPFLLIDNPELGFEVNGHEGDDYIWPRIEVGNSPLADHRRIYMHARNYEENSSGRRNYNIIYGYADFNVDDLYNNSQLDWTFQTFSYFDNYHYNNIDRVQADFVISTSGQVAFFGNVADDLFVLLSNDYGETFDIHTRDVYQEFYHPETGDLMCFHPSEDGSHRNGVFTNDNNRIVWMGGINVNTVEAHNDDTYMPAYFYPKIFSFDIATAEFKFYEMDVQLDDPANDEFCIPIQWSPYDMVYKTYFSYPSWYYDGSYSDSYFHEGRFQICANNNWVVAAWHDCRHHVEVYLDENYESSWYQQPELCFSISTDGGITWSEIKYMNSNQQDSAGNYYSEFGEGTITNISLAENLEVISNEPGNYHAVLNVAFYRDNSYGAYAQGNGEDLGGTICYTKLDIEFPEVWNGEIVDADNDEIEQAGFELHNYPNPFNPSTTISFELNPEITENTGIEIYNVKGQKIKTYTVTLSGAEGSGRKHSITWNGTDNHNNPVSSGVYFYSLKQGNKVTASSKMLLMK